MKLNDSTVKKLEEAFAIGASVSEACFYADITRQTYYNWIKENEEMKEKFDRLQQTPILKARQTIAKALGTDVDIAKWYLERKMKREFSTRTESQNTHKILPQPIYGGKSTKKIQGHDSNEEDILIEQKD